jgi:hypothetical protein
MDSRLQKLRAHLAVGGGDGSGSAGAAAAAGRTEALPSRGRAVAAAGGRALSPLLSDAEIRARFDADGYVVVPGFFGAAELAQVWPWAVESLRAHVHVHLCARRADGGGHSMTLTTRGYGGRGGARALHAGRDARGPRPLGGALLHMRGARRPLHGPPSRGRWSVESLSAKFLHVGSSARAQIYTFIALIEQVQMEVGTVLMTLYRPRLPCVWTYRDHF